MLPEQPWEVGYPVLEDPEELDRGQDCIIVWNPQNKKVLMVTETSIQVDTEDGYDLQGMMDDVWNNFVLPKGYNSRGYRVINCFIDWDDLGEDEKFGPPIEQLLWNVNGGKSYSDYITYEAEY